MHSEFKFQAMPFTFSKNKKGEYINMNTECAVVHGFNSTEEVIGKTDYDLPTGMAKFADVFRENDSAVIKKQALHKFLEIQPCGDNTWRVFYVEKSPLLVGSKIIGTKAVFSDISSIGQVLFEKMALQIYMKTDSKKINRLQKYNEIITNLSDKRKACLFYYIIGNPIKLIAKRLDISPRTVEDHIDAIKNRLHFSCRSQLHFLLNDQSLYKIFSNFMLNQQSSIRLID